MAKPDNSPEKQTWGTWEELLLACAVHRYGNDSWDSVAMELQKRTSTLQQQHQSLFFTPLSCQHKFQDLKRRFAENDVGTTDDDAKTSNNDKSVSTTAVPWLDELRKLRVAELRREVQQYDISIVSLQLKVQKLKEEREQSLTQNRKETEKPDLERDKEGKGEEERNEPEDQTRKTFHGDEEPDRENRSVNESNSTDPKDERPGTGTEKVKTESEPVEPEGCETRKKVENVKPAREDSCNGSCDGVAKESAENSERVDPRRETGDSPESVAESKGEEHNRESSDVQSSASLSGKEKKKAEPDEPDEPDNEELDQSPAIKEVSIESQPLVEFLEIFRSHKLGSLFERRLESQEKPDYMNLIRQHLDFETIRTRIEEGWYSGCKSKFFRDLLLLFNNAILFFGKKSSEYKAATEFRQLVTKEIAAQFPNSNLLSKEQSSTQMTLKTEPERSLSLSMKPKLSVPLTACRKRSSITAKASTSSSGQEKKRQPIASLMNDKSALDWKQNDKSSEKAEESLVTKKRTRERSTSVGARKGNKNAKARNNSNTSKNSDANTNSGLSSKGGGSSNENSESKAEKEKSNSTNVSSKKRSAANFLNRMKRSSSSNNGPLVETLKGVISSDNGKGDGGEQKKNSNSKVDQRKEDVSTPRTRSGGKRTKDRGSPAKKTTGRPPKRAAAPSPATPSASAKRGREAVENDSGTGHPKKRSRK